jgi:hypothetical protein
VFISLSDFVNGHASGNGGMLYFNDVNSVEIKDSTFTNSTSDGMLYLNNVGIMIERSNFVNSSSYNGGFYTILFCIIFFLQGFIYIRNNGGEYDVFICHSDFVNGHASENGGMLYLEKSRVTIETCTFSHSQSTIGGFLLFYIIFILLLRYFIFGQCR